MSLIHPKKLVAVYPQGTVGVSVTGLSCDLNCAHCGGHYLKGMVPVDSFEQELAKKGSSSILLSGGCKPSGNVPLVSHLKRLRENPLGKGLRINVHPGVTDDASAEAIGNLATVISFDFVLDQVAIRKAYNGMWTPDDYVRTLRALRKGKAEVVPHVLVGIREGKIGGEYDAVRFLLNEGIKRIIFIVLIPTKGTRWESLQPPTPQEVARLLAWTREQSPDLDICLGCMRPRGAHRKELDPLAVLAGVNRIVLPHPDALELAKGRGMEIVRKEECCAFA